MLDKSMDTLKVTVSHLQHRQMIPQWAIKGISISRKKECQGLFMGLLWRCQKTGGSWGVVVSMFIIGRCCLLALIIYLCISWVCIQSFPFTYSKTDSTFPKNVYYYFTGLFIFCYKRPNGKYQIWKFAEWWCSFFLFQLRTFFSRWFTPKPIWNGCNRICKRRTCPLSRRMTLLEKTGEKC